MKKRIKLLFLMSSTVAIVTPIATVLSCGSQKNEFDGDNLFRTSHKIISSHLKPNRIVDSTIYTQNFFDSVKSTITFTRVVDGKSNIITINDNKTLNTGIANTVLQYGWSLDSSTPPGGYVSDYHQLKDMANGYIFWVVITPYDGYFIGDGQQTTLQVTVESSNDIYTKTFFDTVKSTISFSRSGWNILVNDNATLNAGIANATLKYGWSLDPSILPEGYVTDYHQLKDMQDNYIFWIVVTPNTNFYICDGQQTSLSLTAFCPSSPVMPIVKTEDFFNSVQKTIIFVQDNDGYFSIKTNATLGVGLENATLLYGWSLNPSTPPGGYVGDYRLIRDMQDGYIFWIVVNLNFGSSWGDGQQTTLKISVKRDNYIYTQDFFDAVKSTISFSGAQWNLSINENATLNDKLGNTTLKYGWSLDSSTLPEDYITDYHQLKDIEGGHVLWIIVIPDDSFSIASGQEASLSIDAFSATPSVMQAVKTWAFFNLVGGTLCFVYQDSGNDLITDNAALDAGFPNSTLVFGWSMSPNIVPDNLVTDYHQIKDLYNGYIFWIIPYLNLGFSFAEGELPHYQIIVES